MTYLTIDDISKRFNGHMALEKINLEINKGEIVCLLGPSGCGKTTLLRIIAGLTTPDRGRILLDNCNLNGVPPHARCFGLMFQEFALFPHKNVFENVAFGLKMQLKDRKEIERRSGEMLELVGMTGFEQRNVADLSGGERQRVALARSLAPKPRLLMLDEPLGALDRALRQRLMVDLIRILRNVKVTTIFVTHDQSEAFAMADFIAVMHAGGIEQINAPETLYKHPVSARVARFLGFENLIQAVVIEPGKVKTPLGIIAVKTDGFNPGHATTVLLRPESGLVSEGAQFNEQDTILIQVVVLDSIFMGHCYRLRVATEKETELTLHVSNETPPPSPGSSIKLLLKTSAMTLIKEL